MSDNENATVGFAIIGCGTIAKVHARAIADTKGATLRAVYGRRLEAAETFAAQVKADGACDENCAVYNDFATLLTDPKINAVSITTSSGSHAAYALEALAAGKHVLVEKPMAMTADEARAMVQQSHKTGKVLEVVSQRRFESHHQATKKAIQEGALGPILLAEVSCPFFRDQAYYDSAPWRGTLAQDGGALMNQSIHSVDLLLWLCGPVSEVFARTATQTHQMEAEDLALVTATLQSGGYATLMASTSIQPGFNATLNIYGEKGSIKLSGADIAHWSVPGMIEPEAPGGSALAIATHLLTSHEHHKEQYENLVLSIQGHGPIGVPGADGYAAVAFVEAVYRSAKQGQSVTPAQL